MYTAKNENMRCIMFEGFNFFKVGTQTYFCLGECSSIVPVANTSSEELTEKKVVVYLMIGPNSPSSVDSIFILGIA